LKYWVLGIYLLHLGKKTIKLGSKVANPYIKIRICGVPIDDNEYRTANPFNRKLAIDWNESHSFQIHMSDMAIILLRVEIPDKVATQIRIASFALPLRCLRQGYRIMQLKDSKGIEVPGSELLCHLRFDN